MANQKIAKMLYEIAGLLEIKGVAFKPAAYRKAAKALEGLEKDIALIYEEKGIRGVREIPGVGKSISEKIEEFLKKKRLKYLNDLQKETALRQIITHYFKTKEVSLEELKRNAKKRKIVYSRFTKPAKQLLELAGSLENAKEAISKVAEWAKSRGLDYSVETVFKKWLELGRLKPKEVVKKPFFRQDPMIWSETKQKWYVISPVGEWLEFAGKKSEIEWRIVK